MKHLKKISEEVLHKNPWWVYKHDTYEKPNGEIGDYFYGENEDSDGGVLVVPVLPDNRLLLILQQRYLQEKQSIEFPRGTISSNEIPKEAASRELLEETGYQIDELIKVGEFQGNNSRLKNVTHVFLAYVSEGAGQKLDDSEEIEILYRRPDEVGDMVVKNEIWDGQTLAAWAMVHHHFLHKE